MVYIMTQIYKLYFMLTFFLQNIIEISAKKLYDISVFIPHKSPFYWHYQVSPLQYVPQNFL